MPQVIEYNKNTVDRSKEEQQGYSVAENTIFLEMTLRKERFIRQYEIGPYKADFYLPQNNLVLEIDGANYHSDIQQQKKDRIRDRYMNDLGYGVVRVTGSIVNKNASGIVGVIKHLNRPSTYFINSEQDIANIYRVLSRE